MKSRRLLEKASFLFSNSAIVELEPLFYSSLCLGGEGRVCDRDKSIALGEMGESSKTNVVNVVAPLICQHCAGPLSKEMETSHWTVPPLIRDSFSMIGSAVGGTTSAFYGFNYVMPTVRKWVKGPIWLHFLIGAPPVIVFSSACAGLSGGAVPALAQLASSSYHAAAMLSPSLSNSSQEENAQKCRTSSTCNYS